MKNRKWLLFVSGCLLLPQLLFAQSDAPFFPQNKEPESTNNNMQQEQSLLLAENQILDAPVNPNEYLVGPGDIIAINIGGENQGYLSLPITPEGMLLIPTVATLDLRGLTLAQAKVLISNAVKKKYIRSQVDVVLIGVRKIRVVVAGQVETPGSVFVSAVDRASDAIRIANLPVLNKEPLKEESEEAELETDEVTTKTIKYLVEVDREPAKRHVVLTRMNGEKIPVDLMRYEVTGKTDRNPYLLEGDQIYVPVLSKNTPSVEVLGAVQEKGVIEFLEGDRVMDAIELCHGFMADADRSDIEIIRFNPDHKTTYSIHVDLSDSSDIEKNNVELHLDDVVSVKFIGGFNRKNNVEVKGEVKYPGFYAIEDGKTRLADVIEAAGGFTQNTSLRESFIKRRYFDYFIDPEVKRLELIATADMSSVEREYLKMSKRQGNDRVEVDFDGLFNKHDSTQNILLYHKDYIEIARKSRIVHVMGKVNRPGIVEFEKGKTLDYYVQKAGDFSWNARWANTRIIRYETGDWIQGAANTEIYMGDTIFVPEKPDIQIGSLTKDVFQIGFFIINAVYLIDRLNQ
ncbi:SLBB domain-containing protein [candidate division KSB1 bacterium]|nr:SLBB domain-containing protein [candidate division KSB1 bacterium]